MCVMWCVCVADDCNGGQWDEIKRTFWVQSCQRCCSVHFVFGVWSTEIRVKLVHADNTHRLKIYRNKKKKKKETKRREEKEEVAIAAVARRKETNIKPLGNWILRAANGTQPFVCIELINRKIFESTVFKYIYRILCAKGWICFWGFFMVSLVWCVKFQNLCGHVTLRCTVLNVRGSFEIDWSERDVLRIIIEWININ